MATNVPPKSYRAGIYASYASVSGLSNTLASKYQSLAHNLTTHLRTVPPEGRILDIGSGQGELLELCRDLGVEAEGVDISKELVDACRSRGLKVTLVSDLHDFLITESTWALVSMIDVLEHFTREEALDILTLVRARLQRPDGKVVLQTPNMQSPFASLNLYHDLSHEWGYTEASITQLLRTAGFREVRVHPQQYPLKGAYIVRHLLRMVLYLGWRIMLVVDQPSRGQILTPNLIAVASV